MFCHGRLMVSHHWNASGSVLVDILSAGLKGLSLIDRWICAICAYVSGCANVSVFSLFGDVVWKAHENKIALG